MNDIHSLRQSQCIDTKIWLVGIARDLPRIIIRTEEPGILTRPDEWTFTQKRRQVDARWQSIIASPQVGESG
jgi:hypothetical protein